MATRPYVTSFTRKVDNRYEVLNMRHYARLNTAIPKSIARLLDYGQPGDKVEIAHAEHGFQIAVISAHVGGVIRIRIDSELEQSFTK